MYSDVTVLIAAAYAKNKECLENAAECARSAEEVGRMMWWE